jgi:hypothetical protein
MSGEATYAGFALRAAAHFAQWGVRIERVLTDRAMNYVRAYARLYRSNEARIAALGSWLDTYTHRRPHTPLGGSRQSRGS